MTTDPHALIRILNRLGMRLSEACRYLICHGPRGKMTDELRQLIETHKAALMKVIK